MATISLSGTASNLITYTGSTKDRSSIVAYIPITSIGVFYKVKTDRIAIQINGYMDEYAFDDEAQRDTAMAVLLSYY